MMHIVKNIYDSLLSVCANCTHEIGGILGGRTGVVTTFISDKGLPTERTDYYIPNTAYLNRMLTRWRSAGTEFYGVFHTHPNGEKSLSYADKAYIESVVRTCAEDGKPLYFPIILPEGEMLVYRAETVGHTVAVKRDAVFLAD